jgi:IS5 family transposase
LSDEQAGKRWRENPYWQYFSGGEYFEHKFPFDPSSMSRWRKRISVEGMMAMLQETLAVAHQRGVFKMSSLSQVLADTTVQEKNITFPKDPKLYHRARQLLVREAERYGLDLRQSYVRVSKIALIKTQRYRHAKQFKRAWKFERKLNTYLGRVIRDVRRKIAGNTVLTEAFAEPLAVAWKVYTMPDTKQRLYSIHEPKVECIGKGKAHKRFEFGVKVSILSTRKLGFILSCDAMAGSPYDGHTLRPALEQAEQIVGRSLDGSEVAVDLGYRGHKCKNVTVFHPRLKRISPRIRKFVRSRSKIEAIISGLKIRYRMGRNFLKGQIGDRLNAILAACAHNLGITLRHCIS